MPWIKFKKKYPPLEVKEGAYLMAALLRNGIPVASSCLGKGVCSKCRIEIIAGKEFLSLESEAEKNLRVRNKITDNLRISCQTQVYGDIEIDATYW